MITGGSEVYFVIGEPPVGFQTHNTEPVPTPDARVLSYNPTSGKSKIADIFSKNATVAGAHTVEYTFGRYFRQGAFNNVYIFNNRVPGFHLRQNVPGGFVPGEPPYELFIKNVEEFIKGGNYRLGGIIFFSPDSEDPALDFYGMYFVHSKLNELFNTELPDSKVVLFGKGIKDLYTVYSYIKKNYWARGYLTSDDDVVPAEETRIILHYFNQRFFPVRPIIYRSNDLLSSTLGVVAIVSLLLGVSFLVPVLTPIIPVIIIFGIGLVLGTSALLLIPFALLVGLTIGGIIFKSFFYEVK